MLCFRSEEAVDSWCGRRELTRGAVMSLERTWELAQVWFGGFEEPDWRARTAAEKQQIVDSVGLRGDFWTF